MRREHPPSFEGLAAALEAVSGQPMQDFFDVWVHTGLAPEIEVEWSFEDGVVRGRAWSGIPFGAVEIPVRIEGGDQRVEHMLRIENGQSEFELVWPHPTAPAQLRVDPTNALLLKRGSGRVFVPTRDSAQGEVG
jgi:aminopeptidase N